jgi:hypothetical protein
MKLFNWSRKQNPPQVEQIPKAYKVILHHRTGNSLELENVSLPMVTFIRNNIGRDEIYAQENIIINLRNYSMAQILEMASNIK